MGAQAPFLYDSPSRYSFTGPTEKGFNPRAATQASWTPSIPRPKPNGPLINLNRHPDSVCALCFLSLQFTDEQQYFSVPYGNLDAKPMPPNTHNRVKYSRLAQLVLRILALLGTLGLLVCVIVIKGTSSALGWIIRVAPSVGVLHTVYAIYHLCHASNSRTAGSSASYMLFAAMTDAGLIPFLAFTAYMAYNEYATAVYQWETLFDDPQKTPYIMHATFLLCVIEGAFFLLSFIIGVYLTVVFRKISKLPPDMNPLEPNLTSRPHKRNKSEFTVADKHMSQASLVSSNRLSTQADPLIPSNRRVPFMHTRTDSVDSVPLYQNNNAPKSHMDASQPVSFYGQTSHSRRGSYASLDKSIPNRPSRPQSTAAPSFTSRPVGGGLEHRPARSSNLAVDGQLNMNTEIRHVPSAASPDHHRPISPYLPGGPVNDENVPPPVSPISSRASTPDQTHQGAYVEIKDWYTSPHTKNRISQDFSSVQTPQYSPSGRSFLSEKQGTRNLYEFDPDLPVSSHAQKNQETSRGEGGVRNPLGMNPPYPTRPQDSLQQEEGTLARDSAFEEEPKRYALHDAPVNLPPISQRPKVSSRPSSFVGSGSKGRYYGSLRSPVGSVVTASANTGSTISKHSNSNSKYSNRSSNRSSNRNNNNNSLKHEITSDTASDYSNYRTETMDSHIEIYPDEQNDYLEMVTSANTVDDHGNDDGPHHSQRPDFSWNTTSSQHDLASTLSDYYLKDRRVDHDDQHQQQQQQQQHDYNYDYTSYAGGGRRAPSAKSVSDDDDNDDDNDRRESDRKGRVVSNTAHDLSSGYAGLGAEFGRGMGRRREVSGKVAEEGRSMGYSHPHPHPHSSYASRAVDRHHEHNDDDDHGDVSTSTIPTPAPAPGAASAFTSSPLPALVPAPGFSSSVNRVVEVAPAVAPGSSSSSPSPFPPSPSPSPSVPVPVSAYGGGGGGSGAGGKVGGKGLGGGGLGGVLGAAGWARFKGL